MSQYLRSSFCVDPSVLEEKAEEGELSGREEYQSIEVDNKFTIYSNEGDVDEWIESENILEVREMR